MPLLSDRRSAVRAVNDASQAAVVIPAYNSEATIRRAVASALAQEGVSEVVVVDDASEDATVREAEAAGQGDPRLTVLRMPRNSGPGAARNRAVASSAAPWIAPLDADDFMEPGRIATLAGIACAEDWDFVADDLLKVEEGKEDGPRARLCDEAEIGRRTLALQDFVLGNLTSERAGRREFGFLKPIMRRAFLDEHNLSYSEGMRLGEDYCLYASALAKGARFVLIDPQGYVAVVRRSSLSGRHAARDLKALLSVDLRLLNEGGLGFAERAALRRHQIDTHKRWAWARLIEAVRRRDPWDAAACFAAPPAVVATLASNLMNEAFLRAQRRLRG